VVDGEGVTTGHNETFDFTNVENPADIICNIHGHMHNCASKMVSSQTDSTKANYVAPWLWRFCVPNMCYGRYNEKYDTKWGEVDEVGNKVEHTKVMGTAKETSFNIVSIDRKNEKIYAHIFGAGIDRVFSYAAGYIPQTFAITTNLVNCVGAGSNATTITEDGTVILTFTANSGYKLPDSVSVTGANYTWNATEGTLELSVPTSDITIVISAYSTNLINMVGRQYQTTQSSSSFLENTDTRELRTDRYYAIDYQGRRGTYCDGKLVSHSILADTNGFKFQVSSTTGYGLEFPVPVGGGKTYEFKCSWVTNSADVWLVKYNPNTTFNEITKLKRATADISEFNETTATFTTEANYIYSLAFTRALKNADISAVNMSLKEI
jgi:hypothetical protein